MTSLRRAAIGLAFWAGITGAGVGGAAATELRVFSAGAVRAIVTELAQAFQQETGHTVTLSFGTVGVTRGKLASAEPVDVVIMTDAAIDDVASQGAVVPGTRADLARTGMGLGVREGAPRPDITTSEAFKQTLLAAKSIVYVDPSRAPPAASISRACWTGSASRRRCEGRASSCPAAIRPRRSRPVRPRWWCTRSARSCR